MKQAYRDVLQMYPWRFSTASVRYALDSGILDVSGFHQYADYSNENGETRELIVYDPSIVVNYFKRKNFSVQIIASIKAQKFLVVCVQSKDKYTVINLAKIKSGIIDLNDSGERWEGEIYGTLPCGWGTYFSKEGNAVYTGFRFWGWIVCYGTYYFQDLEPPQPRYRGMFCFNKNFGKGTIYSRTGTMIKTVETINGRSTESNDIVVPPETSDRLYYNNLMRSFTVQENCYMDVSRLVFTNFPCLKTIVIMNNSYNSTRTGLFMIENCPELQSIKVEKDSFDHYSFFKVLNCPKLETLEIGAGSFSRCLFFCLEGLDVAVSFP